MAHKTLVGGTVYEIKGGRTLVGGTGYDIKKGRTLVGGTGYDISFAKEPVIVNITGQGGKDGAQGRIMLASVTVGGQEYTSPATLEVPYGEVITLYANSVLTYAKIIIDGETVASGVNLTYEYIAQTDCTINMAKDTFNGTITVTTS